MDDEQQPQTAVRWVKQHSKHRKAIRQVLTELAMFIDAGNSCPSHKDIADETGLSKTTVRHSLGELEKDGTITITKNGGAKVKGGKKDCYSINGFKPAATAPESVATTTVVPTTTVITTAQMVTTVTSDTLKHEQHETGTTEYVRAGGDAATRVTDMSEKQKDKNKSKKKKDKNISPNGESVLPETSDSPNPVNHREMHTAVCDAFKLKPGGFVGILAQQLLGTAKKDKRHEYAITPPMTAVEVVAFGQWYREVFGMTVKVPTTAETLRDRVMQFRDDTTRHAKKMAISEQRLARLMQPEAKPETLPPTGTRQTAPVEREGTLKSGDMLPVQESEVAGYVKAGLMTADEFPRPTMKTIFDRLAERMGSNHNAVRIA